MANRLFLRKRSKAISGFEQLVVLSSIASWDGSHSSLLLDVPLTEGDPVGDGIGEADVSPLRGVRSGVSLSGICPSDPEDTNVRPELLEFVVWVVEDPDPDAAEPLDGDETPEAKNSSPATGGYNGLK